MSTQRTVLALLLVATLGPIVCAQSEAPLPAGARARLGSIGIAVGKSTAIAISPDGKYVAVGSMLFERATGTLIAKYAEIDPVNALSFAPTGNVAALLTDHGKLMLRRIPSGDLLTWVDVPTSKTYTRPPSFSRDGKTVAIGTELNQRTAGRQRALVWDAQTGESRGTFEVLQGAACRTALSSDGKVLATWGLDEKLLASSSDRPATTIQVWDVAAGKELRRIIVDGKCAADVAFAPNARHLAAASDSVLQLFDVNSGKEVQRLDLAGNTVSSLRYSPDGGLLVAFASDGGLIAWDVATWKRIKVDSTDKVLHEDVAFPAKGQIIALAKIGQMLFTWDALAGKPSHHGMPVTFLQFSADGNTVSCLIGDGTLMNWDTVKGTVFHPRQEASRRTEIERLRDHRDEAVLRLRKEELKVLNEDRLLSSDAFHLFIGDNSAVARVRIFQGKQIRHLVLNHTGQSISAFALAPDGRKVAFALDGVPKSEDGQGNDALRTRIQVWELATAQLCGEFVGHGAKVNHIAFSPDSRTLASGSDDSTVILWDASRPHEKNAQRLSLEAAWKALALPDGRTAFRAHGQMLAAPAETLAFLRKHLKPAVAPDLDMEKLIADLDSDDFETRDTAFATLEKLGVSAEPNLRKAHEGRVSLEMGRRIDNLLARIECHELTGDDLRASRAIEVLERIDTAEARALLESIARGSPAAVETSEARAALARMMR